MRNFLYIILLFSFSAITHNGHAQCDVERHSTNWYDGWTSCEESASPNANRPESHWIMYDLKTPHRLDRTHIWNYNDVNNLSFGLNEVVVDYSMDGSTWVDAGTYSLSQADGSPTYAGNAGPNLGGVRARFVLITALSNHGGSCFALSEIRIEAEEINIAIDATKKEHVCLTVNVFPNPMRADSRVYVESTCKGDVQYQLVNMLGEVISKGNMTDELNQNGHFNLEAQFILAGEYVLEVATDEGNVRKTIIKL